MPCLVYSQLRREACLLALDASLVDEHATRGQGGCLATPGVEFEERNGTRPPVSHLLNKLYSWVHFNCPSAMSSSWSEKCKITNDRFDHNYVRIASHHLRNLQSPTIQSPLVKLIHEDNGACSDDHLSTFQIIDRVTSSRFFVHKKSAVELESFFNFHSGRG